MKKMLDPKLPSEREVEEQRQRAYKAQLAEDKASGALAAMTPPRRRWMRSGGTEFPYVSLRPTWVHGWLRRWESMQRRR